MRSQQQSVLTALGRAALAAGDPAALLQQAADLIAAALPVEFCAIFELLADGRELCLRAEVRGAAPLSSRSSELATAAADYALRTGLPALVADWATEPRFHQPLLLRERQVSSSVRLCIPGSARPLGILALDSTTRRNFAADLGFLQAVAGVLSYAVEHQRAVAALRRSKDRLRQVITGPTDTLITDQDSAALTAHGRVVLEERQRLARDLHDSVTQALYGITLYSEAATRTLAAGDVATLAVQLRELQDTAQEALQEMRLLIFELRPPLLEQEGLVAALRARLEAVEGRSRLDTKFDVGGEISVPATVEQALYRIAQETLNNVLKHACAHNVSVSLRQEAAQISLEIADDGVGFDPASTQRRGGMGLHGMIERVQQLRGQIAVLSAPGRGTRVLVEVPL